MNDYIANSTAQFFEHMKSPCCHDNNYSIGDFGSAGNCKCNKCGRVFVKNFSMSWHQTTSGHTTSTLATSTTNSWQNGNITLL